MKWWKITNTARQRLHQSRRESEASCREDVSKSQTYVWRLAWAIGCDLAYSQPCWIDNGIVCARSQAGQIRSLNMREDHFSDAIDSGWLPLILCKDEDERDRSCGNEMCEKNKNKTKGSGKVSFPCATWAKNTSPRLIVPTWRWKFASLFSCDKQNRNNRKKTKQTNSQPSPNRNQHKSIKRTNALIICVVLSSLQKECCFCCTNLGKCNRERKKQKKFKNSRNNWHLFWKSSKTNLTTCKERVVQERPLQPGAQRKNVSCHCASLLSSMSHSLEVWRTPEGTGKFFPILSSCLEKSLTAAVAQIHQAHVLNSPFWIWLQSQGRRQESPFLSARWAWCEVPLSWAPRALVDPQST